MLEETEKRIALITRHHPATDMSLDIDLVRDELRQLYRALEMLREVPGEVAAPPSPVTEKEQPVVKEEKTSVVPEELQEQQDELVPDVPEETVQEPEKEEPVQEAEDEALPPEAESREVKAEDHSIPAGDELGEREEAPVASQETPQQDVADQQGKKQNQTVLDLLSPFSQKTIGDKYLGEDNSLHQRIAVDKEDKSIGARLQQEPVASIKDVIGVNEKFLFINELFEGNIEVYNGAISRLNEMPDMQAAFDHLNELGKRHSWDAGRSSATIEKLANLVQRRYMK
ncbi:MAG: hypothetical protein RG741_07720 [Bacteroidales bacterium]|nr:hypothetical protein [Bacteroidales bacterium]